jgi:23S rRNA (pseudouridine1915-N3)-methyltransferase
LKIQIIQIGKSKDAYIRDGVDELKKRLSIFAHVEISTLDKGKNLMEESLKIQKIIPKNSFIVVLDEKGKEMGSIEFSKVLENAKDHGYRLVFVIGGAFGLSENLKKNCNLLLSMSRMTFTHQMIRLFLLEQIYRGFCILNGKEYHY